MHRQHKKRRKTETTSNSTTPASTWQGEYQDIDMGNQTPTLPAEGWALINDYLPKADKSADRSRFAQVCRGSYALGYVSDNGNGFHNSFIRIKREQVQKLLLYVVRGQQKEAEEMILADPSLLLERGRVKDYSGRIIEGTALQMALGAEDVRYHDDEECMAEMIQRHLRTSTQFDNGEKIIAAQIAEQFPEGWEEEEKKRAEQDLKALNEVIEAIAQSQNDGDCDLALAKFRSYLEPDPKNVIKTGKHFNVQLLVEAFRLYDEKYDEFGKGYEKEGKWNSPKNKLFWQKGIGTIQRYLPACYAQAFCQGIYYIVKNGEKLERSFKFRFNDKDVSFFPLDSDPGFRLGYEFAGRVRGAALCRGGALGAAFYKLCQTKNINVARIYAASRQSREEPVCRNVAF